jgi:hypothetical protein
MCATERPRSSWKAECHQRQNEAKIENVNGFMGQPTAVKSAGNWPVITDVTICLSQLELEEQ